MCGTEVIFREHACMWVGVMHMNLQIKLKLQLLLKSLIFLFQN